MATFPPLRQLRIKTWTKHIESGWKPDPAAAEKLDVNEDESSNSLDCLLMEGGFGIASRHFGYLGITFSGCGKSIGNCGLILGDAAVSPVLPLPAATTPLFFLSLPLAHVPIETD
jgi:hypothetical protein